MTTPVTKKAKIDPAALRGVLEVEGDLLEYDAADYIVQQCNCLTVRSHGLSDSIAKVFPEANPYARRRGIGSRNLCVKEDRGSPGSIEVFGRVVCLYGQWRPGRIGTSYFFKYPESPEGIETAQLRIAWFRRGLTALSARTAGTTATVAFPDRIGCGLAGGDWQTYRQMLEKFAQENQHLKVVIVKTPLSE